MEEKTVCKTMNGKWKDIGLPHWENLPDLDIYMDQLLSLVARYLGTGEQQDRGLTAAMVNNYVKLGILPAPKNKKYNRQHLSFLIMICVLKPVLPIGDIRRLIDLGIEEKGAVETLYNSFCDSFAGTRIEAAERVSELSGTGDTVSAALTAALRAQAEQMQSLRLLAGLPLRDTAEQLPEKKRKTNTVER